MNKRKFFNSKWEKIVVSLLAILVVVLMAVFVYNKIAEQKAIDDIIDKVNIDSGDVGFKENSTDDSSQKPIKKLSENEFIFDKENKKLTVSDELKEGSFCISTSSETPNQKDNWLTYEELEKTDLSEYDFEENKAFIFYSASSELATYASTDTSNWPTLMERDSKYDGRRVYYAIGSYKKLGVETYAANKIKTITFMNGDTVPTGCDATWDVSATEDGTVTAWIKKNDTDNTMYDLYIGADLAEGEKILAPANSVFLFAYYTNCVEIKNLHLLDTSNVTNMSDMFSICSKVSKLDVSGFDTRSVTNMSDMFNNCLGLTSLELSNFDTSNVTNMVRYV